MCLVKIKKDKNNFEYRFYVLELCKYSKNEYEKKKNFRSDFYVFKYFNIYFLDGYEIYFYFLIKLCLVYFRVYDSIFN